MIGEDKQGAKADSITIFTVNRRPIDRVLGDPVVVLLVLGISEENSALDLLLHGTTGELGEGTCDDGGTLAKSQIIVSPNTMQLWEYQ